MKFNPLAKFTDKDLKENPILRFFEFDHLPEPLQGVSSAFHTLALFIVDALPSNAERTTALRKLLEAKDAGVRANIGRAVAPETFFTRLLKEEKELGERFDKLHNYLTTGANGLPDEQRALLDQQHGAMSLYLRAVRQRIDLIRGQQDDHEPQTIYRADPLAADTEGVLEIRTTGGGSVETPVPFSD